jgi:hypothetical protein
MLGLAVSPPALEAPMDGGLTGHAAGCTVKSCRRRFVSKTAWRSVVLAIVAFAASAASAQAGGLGFTAALPSCDDPAALGKISTNFAQKEARFWNSGLQIVHYLSVRQVAFRPWAVHTIPRRFCTAQAVTSDGIKRRVNYSIIEDGGMIGATWGVEWCIVGLDRNLAYNPACRAALP